MSTSKKLSTTGNVLGRRKKVIPTGLDIIRFEKLKALLLPYEDLLEVKVDSEDHYELWTDEGYRTRSLTPANKRGVQFASIMIYADHVTLYFQPLYLDSALKEGLGEGLKPIFRGKSCFHIKEVTDQITYELQELLKMGWQSYQRMGLVKRD